MKLAKWVIAPAALAFIGYAFVGPNLGGQIVTRASQQIALPEPIKKTVASALKPKPPTIDEIMNAPEPGAGTRAEAQAPEKRAEPTNRAESPKAKSDLPTTPAGPQVEVTVREASIITGGAGNPRGSVKPAEQPKPKRRKRRTTVRKTESAPQTQTDPASAPESNPTRKESGPAGADPAGAPATPPAGDPAGAPPPSW